LTLERVAASCGPLRYPRRLWCNLAHERLFPADQRFHPLTKLRYVRKTVLVPGKGDCVPQDGLGRLPNEPAAFQGFLDASW
jgi:hypothetical protein